MNGKFGIGFVLSGKTSFMHVLQPNFQAIALGYEYLIDTLTLPDPNDRHVLAAAIKSNANAIVTLNLKDFPTAYLAEFDIDVIHPDDFITYQLDLAPTTVCRALKLQRESLKNPPKTTEEFLATLQKQQLPQTVHALREYADFI